MKVTSIERLDPHCDASVQSLAQVYQNIFGNDPGWQEGYECRMCQTTIPLSSGGGACKRCGTLLLECWPLAKIVSDFLQEMQKSKAVCLVAYDQSEIVGFTWGYCVIVTKDLGEHLDAPDLEKLVCGDMFYLDEVAVLPEYQGQGVGTSLLHSLFAQQNQTHVLLRTLEGRTMHQLALKMGGNVLCSISKQRVMMTIPL